MISFIRSLKAALRASNGVAVLSFPASVLPPSFSVRWKHLADTLLSVSAIPGIVLEMVHCFTNYFLTLIVYTPIIVIIFYQMKTRTSHSSFLVTKIWLAFLRFIKLHSLTPRHAQLAT